jgi:two-component system, OmpR family, sensor kinase
VTVPARWRLPRRLVVQVTLYGLVLLVLSVVAVVGVGKIFLEPIFEERRDATARWVVRHLSPLQHDPDRLRREIEDLGPALHADASLYTPDGALVASSVTPPLPPLDAVEVAALADRQPHARGADRALGVGLFDGPRMTGYVITAHPAHGPQLLPGTITLGVILLVLALASIHFARSLTAPLGRVSEAARAFGAGDLKARAGSRRGDEIGDLGRTFDDMADRVVLLLRAQKELLANVSHELRTPLARTRVALELIQDGDAEQARACLPELGEDLAELERLVDDVLIATRLEFLEQKGGLPALRKQPTAMAEMVERSAARFRSLHRDRTLQVETTDELPHLVADGALLCRAIGNLLDNAHKYSEPETPVSLCARTESGRAIVEVRDRGVGIAAEDLPHVFTPFFRGDRSRTRETGGAGLGLPLAQRIVLAHGGTLELESEPGKGTVARVSLPIEAATS